MLPTWLYSYKDYSCRGNLDDSHFDGETYEKAFGFLRISRNRMGDFSEADLRVSLRNEGRDYNEHFQAYKFYFSMRMTFVNEGDSLIFVADLLNAHRESLEDVFERVFRMCIGGVNLQHFNRNHLVDSDYVQFNIEHTDFTDYVYSSRNVKYSELNYAILVGGVTNWLNNLVQSKRQMDINHDWSLSLQVSSTTNVHRSFGDPPHGGYGWRFSTRSCT